MNINIIYSFIQAAERFQMKTFNKQSIFVPYYEECGLIPKGFDRLKPPSFIPDDIKIHVKKNVKMIFIILNRIDTYLYLLIKVYMFLISNKGYKDSIDSALEKIQCSVIWQCTDLPSSPIAITLTWKGTLGHERVLESWTSKVIKCFQQKLRALDQCNIQVSASEFNFVLFHVRSFKSNNKNLRIEIDKTNNNFIAVGPKKRVWKFHKLIEDHCIIASNTYFELEAFKPHEVQLIKKLPAHEGIRKQCKIQVFENETGCLMLLTGNKECVKNVQSKFKALKNKIKEEVLEGLPQPHVVDKIERSLEENNINAVLRVDSGVLKMYSFHDLKAARERLERMIQLSTKFFFQLEGRRPEADLVINPGDHKQLSSALKSAHAALPLANPFYKNKMHYKNKVIN